MDKDFCHSFPSELTDKKTKTPFPSCSYPSKPIDLFLYVQVQYLKTQLDLNVFARERSVYS